MTSYIRSYCCAIMILLLGSDTSANFTYDKELYDGSQCTTEHGEPGVCTKLMGCSTRILDVLAKNRTGDAAGRCGFDGHIEIVCCPTSLRETYRPANRACSTLVETLYNIDPIRFGCVTCTVGGGSGAIGGEFPFMAALGYVNKNGKESDSISYDCGGSLIALEYVLTAAHCVSNSENRVPEWVRVGYTNMRSAAAQVIPIDRAIPHSQYRRGQHYHDIAVVKLQRPVSFSRWAHPICLRTTFLSPSMRRIMPPLITIGFGAKSPDDASKSDKLMKSANLNFVPVSLCNESYTNFAPLPRGIDNTMICAVDRNSTRVSDACEGDSGGPLLMVYEDRPTLEAVTAFGKSCRTVVPSVYTSVLAYLDWIESAVWPEETKSFRISSRNPTSLYSDHVSSLRSNGDQTIDLIDYR